MSESRASTVSAVRTPLALYALIVLVVEAILGSVAVTSSGDLKTYVSLGMLAAFLLVIVVVSVLAVKRPESLDLGQSQFKEQAVRQQTVLHTLSDTITNVVAKQKHQVLDYDRLIDGLSQLFPEAPENVDKSEWQYITQLMRDQRRISEEILKELEKAVAQLKAPARD